MRRTFKVTSPAKVHITVPVSFGAKAGAAAKRAKHGVPLVEEHKQTAAIHITPYRLATRTMTPGVPLDDGSTFLRNAYIEISMETDLNPTVEQLTRAKRAMVDARRKIRTLYGNRELWSTHQLQADDETLGTGTYLSLLAYDRSVVERVPLLGTETATWKRRPTPEARIASLESLLAHEHTTREDRRRIEAEIATVMLEYNEVWVEESRPRIGRAAVAYFNVSPGQRLLAVESARHFESWDAGSVGDFAFRIGPSLAFPQALPPFVRNAKGSGLEIDLWLAPQVHETEAAWLTEYAYSGLGFLGVLYLSNRHVFRDALPFSPVGYRTTEIGGLGLNDTAMSRHIQRTRAYAQMLAADQGLVFHSLYFSLDLVQRFAGTWLLREADLIPDTLCGIVRVNCAGGSEECHIIRTSTVARPSITFDSGALETDLVTPYIEGVTIIPVRFGG